MTRILEVLRRADRGAAVAMLLVLTTSLVVVGAQHRQPTNNQAADHPHTVQLAARAPAIERPQLVAADAIIAAPSAFEQAMVKFAAEQKCLAEAMYYEARGEGLEGQEAVAEVVFHRLQRRNYPPSICGIVYQGAHQGPGCQFSFVCNGEMKRAKTPSDWARARLLAAKILSGSMVLGNVTNGATAFHAIDVEPDWTDLERTVQIGNHVFYRPVPRVRAS